MTTSSEQASSSRARLWCALLLALVALACGPRGPQQMPDAERPDLVLDTSEIADSFLLHHEVLARFGDDELVFEAVLQKKDDVLTLVALTPQGGRAYMVQQRGKTVTAEQYIEARMPFPPWRLLTDVHRCYFRGSSSPLGDGTRELADRGEVVEEVWKRGRIVRRRYRNGSEIVAEVEYLGPGQRLLERRVVYRNRQLGYTLDIRPIRYSPLTSSSEAALPVAGALESTRAAEVGSLQKSKKLNQLSGASLQ